MIPDVRRHPSRSRRALLALACLLPTLAACRAKQPDPAAQPEPAAQPTHAAQPEPPTQPKPAMYPAVFAVAEVAGRPGPDVREHAFARSTEPTAVPLHMPESFRVAKSSVTSDDSGQPVVGFELAPEEQARFRSWTARRVGRDMALLVDGELYLVARLKSELPGIGYFNGGPRPFTREEALALSERLAPGAP